MWDWDRDEKAYNAKRLVVTIEKSIRRLMAEEKSVDRLNLAVPSPIFSDTDPILQCSLYCIKSQLCHIVELIIGSANAML